MQLLIAFYMIGTEIKSSMKELLRWSRIQNMKENKHTNKKKLIKKILPVSICIIPAEPSGKEGDTYSPSMLLNLSFSSC